MTRGAVVTQMESLLPRVLLRRFCTPPKQGVQTCAHTVMSIHALHAAGAHMLAELSAGWEKFYPKGKGRRPSGKAGASGCCFETACAQPYSHMLRFDAVHCAS